MSARAGRAAPRVDGARAADSLRVVSRIRPLVRVAFVLGVAALLAGNAAACPNCKDSLGAHEIAGWYWSIVGMMSAPFVLLGAGGFALWRLSKKAAGPSDGAA